MMGWYGEDNTEICSVYCWLFSAVKADFTKLKHPTLPGAATFPSRGLGTLSAPEGPTVQFVNLTDA